MNQSTTIEGLRIEPAGAGDVALILSFVRELAEYERLSHMVVATEELIGEALFGEHRGAEVRIAYYADAPVGFALFFHNFSTFMGRRGLYLEDLYVRPEMRRKGFGRALLAHLAQLARERNCARMEWSVLDWNKPLVEFYKSLGAEPMDDWTTFRLTGDALNRMAGAG